MGDVEDKDSDYFFSFKAKRKKNKFFVVVLILNLKSVEEKKVKFTPINITINWIFNHLIFNSNPVIREYQ